MNDKALMLCYIKDEHQLDKAQPQLETKCFLLHHAYQKNIVEVEEE
jgi:hypothetical protein